MKNKTAAFHFFLTPDEKAMLKRASVASGIPQSEIIRRGIARKIEEIDRQYGDSLGSSSPR